MINDKYMDLIDPSHKIAYSLFIKGKPLEAWCSHQPVSIHTLNTISKGTVIEYGVGWHSSPIFHTICAMQGRNLISVDTDKRWLKKFEHFRTSKHALVHIDETRLIKWKHPVFKRKYAIALVDGAPGKARQKFIEAMRGKVDYFIVHDTEEVLCETNPHPQFSYEWDFTGFKHQCHLDKGGPATSLISNVDNFNKDLLTVFE